jgi:2-methylcitrate dehydratase PrpD
MDRRLFMQSMALASAGAATVVQAQAESAASSQGTQGQTRRLAEYASSLRYEDIPADVIQRARDSIADTVAVIMFGGDLPWSRMIAAYARQNGGGGKSRILGVRDALVHAPSAALANGAFAHAFELDNLTKPNSGSHPGATMLSSALAVAQERGGGGRELITAFVAGAEVMIRIGLATKHSNEEHGFHAPGTTGPFGAAVASSKIIGLDAEKISNAIGIAASLAGGILEFAKSGTGAMVKRLHLGRAAESGVLAASLAAEGFTGPVTALEGDFGFLRVFCRDYDMDALTRGLGDTWATRSIMMKRYACHITAHTPVDSALALRAAHGFRAGEVASIGIAGTERMLRVNNIPAPKDVMMAQYSIPFCVALALYRNPVDPRSFDDAAVRDPEILGLASRVTMAVAPPPDNRADLTTTVTIALKDGRTFTRRATDFIGTPERPLGQDELREKFLLLTKKFGETEMARVFRRLQNLELETSLDWIGA